jgi:hypothetical protein
MHTAISPDTLRRSSRVPLALPILVTSMAPDIEFSEVCETLVVNAHGCAVRSPVKLEPGVPVYIHSMEGRQTTAHVVDCQPLGPDHQSWMVGARLDQPDNFWGVNPCPKDWTGVPLMPAASDSQPVRKLAKGLTPVPRGGSSLKVVSPKSNVSEQLSEERLRILISEIVQPLYAEVTSLRERLALPEAKRSQFEVSLSYIPPELEEKLWLRLQQDLGAQALQHASQQAEQVLGSARATIEEKVAGAQHEFRQHLTQELQAVQARAQRLSNEIDDGIRQQLHSGLEKFQEHASQAGTHLALRSEEFFQALQQRLSQEHAAHLREVEQVQAAITAESSRQQDLIGELGNRVGRIDEFSRRLESDVDTRLVQMSSNVIARTRTELENNVGAIMKQMETRNAAQLGNQLDVAGGHLKMMQQEIENSVSESLRNHAEETVRSFEQAMDELAGHAVGRWRRALARDLGSVARILGDEVRLEVVSDGAKQ